MKKITMLLSLLALAGGIVFSSCEKPADGNETDLNQFCIPDSLMSNITLDTVKSEPVTSELKLMGKISFNEDNVVRVFPLAGGHISDVKVSLGDYVQKGQLLATVQSTEMAGMENEFKAAQSDLTVARKNLDVITELRKSGVNSDVDLINAQSNLQKAQASFDKINQVMQIYGKSEESKSGNESGYLIKAPRSGFIVEKNVNAGMELRADDSNSMFTISDLNNVWAVANVFETDIAKIKEGSPVKITTLSYPDKIFDGKVAKISSMLNAESNSVSVKINLDNKDYLLKPGMFANISVFFPENKKMLVVPAKTILYDDNKNFVVLFNKRCDVSLQSVSIYKTFDDKCFIQSDSLQPGSRLIEQNNLFVYTALKKL